MVISLVLLCQGGNSDKGTFIPLLVHYLCRGIKFAHSGQGDFKSHSWVSNNPRGSSNLPFILVDDCFIYLRATNDEACTVKQTLLEYGSASDNESISINLQSP